MRWFAYFILAYIVLGLQLGLSPQVRYHGSAPNLVLLAVVFISLNAPRDEALLGCFLLGALQDLATLEPMGLFALSYGLAAMLIGALGQLANREHPVTQFFMTLFAGMVVAVVVLLHSWIHPLAAMPAGQAAAAPLPLPVRAMMISALYTALLSPMVIGLLQQMRRMFAFEAPSRRKARI